MPSRRDSGRNPAPWSADRRSWKGTRIPGQQTEETTPPAQDGAAASATEEEKSAESKQDTAGQEKTTPDEEAAASSAYVWPIEGNVDRDFSLEVFAYDATMGDWRTHDGLDIAAELGTPVAACAKGTVTDVSTDDMMGVTVTVDHGKGMESVYSNLAESVNVQPGHGSGGGHGDRHRGHHGGLGKRGRQSSPLFHAGVRRGH